ncbi:MAG: phosphoglucosamine mutase [bacterium]
MGKLFGTDGIRGEVNCAPLFPEQILKVGFGLGQYWRSNVSGGSDTVVIGRDSRLSGGYLENLLAAALQGSGFDVVKMGLTSTPALSYLTKKREVSGGIMISASHNPFYDNGIKPFQASGEKFTDDQERSVEKLIRGNEFEPVFREKIGTDSYRPQWNEDYINVLKAKTVNYGGHVVIDCANGSNSKIAPAVLEEMCAQLTVLNDNPDGININRGCGSLHIGELVAAVESCGADLGFAFDGDADRVLAVDEYGRVVDGDTLMYLLARQLLPRGQKADGLVITVMSNLGLRVALEKAGVDYSVVGVGDRQVYNEMKQKGWCLGGEQSGHIIDRNWLPTGDGLNTVVKVLALLDNEDLLLADFNDQVPEYPQVLYNIKVKSKPSLERLKKTSQLIAEIEEKLGSEGRVLVRYSGTEPLARVMLEGKSENQIKKYATEIINLLQEEIGELGEIKND